MYLRVVLSNTKVNMIGGNVDLHALPGRNQQRYRDMQFFPSLMGLKQSGSYEMQ